MPHRWISCSLAVATLSLLALVPLRAADTNLRDQARNIFKALDEGPLAGDTPGSPQQIALGRALFFDPRISADGAVSCARCHQPSLYGTDALPTSIGADHRVHARNAPTVLNAALQFVQHWRGDRSSVEEQATKALVAPPSYGNASYEQAIAKLKAIPGYQALFKHAFPGEPEPISVDNWGRAIGAYVRMLVAPSAFDRFLRGEDNMLSAEAQTGLRTFIEVGCAACHAGAGVGGHMYQKFGLVEDYWKATGSIRVDKGRAEVTNDPADLYVFKVPSLRNVAMTPPYFHDGSVSTLPAAVRVMARVQLAKTLSDEQVTAIVAFLEALTGTMPADFVTAAPLPPAGVVPARASSP